MEEEQQQASQIKTNPYQSPMYNYGSGIILLTNPKDEISTLELTYRSAIIGKKGEVYQIGEPMMNEEGIKSVIGQVQAIVNKVTIMSNLKENLIIGELEFLADTLCRDLMLNRIKYKITNKSSRDKIYFSALVLSFNTMRRSVDEGERRFWKGSVQEVKQTIETDQKRKGLFDFWKGNKAR
jgi:hypothetical protein